MASTDRDALVALYNATDGDNWTSNTNWNTGAPLGQWYGVEQVNDAGRVVKLNLYNNNLKGPIPPELGRLTALVGLLLGRNQLSGPIPPELGGLSKLDTLWLARNKLTGAIPAQLGALNKLAGLDLSNNQLSGTIPKELGKLTALKKLCLYKNQLSGHIPPQLGDLSALTHLFLNSNKLDGSIPPELGELAALQYLYLSENQLTALWDHTQNIQDVHTQNIQDVGREEAAKAESGNAVGRPIPRQLHRLLDWLDGVESLSVDKNPWAEPPEPVVKKGRKDIRGYFEDLYSEPCRIQRNGVKIVLVGQEGAGKTSLCRSMKAKKPDPTREWKKESTVFADVEAMKLGTASARVYDCAGQVAYTGLLQMFLTPRSVCVLVCDAAAFGNSGSGGVHQVDRDCRKLQELRVCDWLRSISQRVPGSDVILVATKCDLAGGNAREIGRRLEEACRTWLASWAREGRQPFTIEEGVSLTSCRSSEEDRQGENSWGDNQSNGDWVCDWRDSTDDSVSPSLLHRLVHKRDGGGLRGAQMMLPRSWDIALTFLEALERGRDAVGMTISKLADADGGKRAEIVEPELVEYHGITVEELSAKWKETVHELAKREVSVTNQEHALEGALSIREFDGSLVRHETFVFLDVVWLAKILKPLLNHKDNETFDGLVELGDTNDACITLHDNSDIDSWRRLKNEGILEPRLAHVMWPAGLSKYVLLTLLSLGLSFPLENDPAGGLVVLLRLEPERPEDVGNVMDTYRSKNTPVFTACWKFFLGVPAGAMEKMLTRCCSLGSVRTFWRFGLLVRGGFGGGDGGVFTVVLEFSSSRNELTAQVYGDSSAPAPWTALSYVISAVSSMLAEFPGMRSRGALECPEHGHPMTLATEVTRRGDPLLRKGAECPKCSPETRGQGAAAVELLLMVDIRLAPGALFDEVKARFDKLDGRYSFPCPLTSPGGEEVLIQKMDGLAATVKGGFDETRAGFAQTNRKLDNMAKTLRDSNMCIKNLLAPNYPYPHLAVVKEVVTGGTRGFMRKLRGVANKDMTLRFLCPVDMSEVPCGVGGEGYRFRETRGWVKKISPVLQVAVVAARVALRATLGVDVEVSGFLQAVRDEVVVEVVDRTLDEEALFRVIAGEGGAGVDMQRVTDSYEDLNKFMVKEESARRGDGYVDFREHMRRVDDGKGGMVWVRTANVGKWQELLSTTAPSR